jgi:hypothetical protein
MGATLQHGDMSIGNVKFDPQMFSNFGRRVIGRPTFDPMKISFRDRHTLTLSVVGGPERWKVEFDLLHHGLNHSIGGLGVRAGHEIDEGFRDNLP